MPVEFLYGRGEPFGRPTLGRSVFCARAHTDSRDHAGRCPLWPPPEGGGFGFDRRAAESNQLHITIGMVSAGLRSEGRDALEQPATPVPGITHDGGDAEGARLEGGAQ